MNKRKSKSVYTMIGSDVEIEGSISLKQGIIIYGQVHGDVKTEGPVRIAQFGLVDGNVTGLDIRVGGTVLGNINSSGQVILGEKCVLKGDIVYRKLLIEDGAQFEGKCDIIVQENFDT